jgi:hypothetical protein
MHRPRYRLSGTLSLGHFPRTGGAFEMGAMMAAFELRLGLG